MEINLLFSLLLCGNLYISICEILHVCQREGYRATLRCGELSSGKVTWSRDFSGGKVDILTTHNGETVMHMADPDRRFRSGADIVLIILKVSQSDAGRYYCNGSTVVLTVMPEICQNTPNALYPGTFVVSTSTSTTTESSTNNDTGGDMGVEVGLKFGGVGLAALVFLLASVAVGKVVLHQAWQAGWAAGRHSLTRI